MMPGPARGAPPVATRNTKNSAGGSTRHKKGGKNQSAACSAAASAWAKGRTGAPVAPEVYKVLAKCRAMGRAAKGKPAAAPAPVPTPGKASPAARLERIREKTNRRGNQYAASGQYHAQASGNGDAWQTADSAKHINRYAAKIDRLKSRFEQAKTAAAKVATSAPKPSPARPLVPKAVGSRADRLAILAKRAEARPAGLTGARKDAALDRSIALKRAAHKAEKVDQAARIAKRAKAAAAPPRPAPPAAVLTPVKQAAAPGKASPARDQVAERLKALRAKAAAAPAKGTDPKSHADHEPGHVGDVPTDALHFDPVRFQYKHDVTNLATGSVGSLSGVKKWDPELAGVVQVWRDPANGKTYVVNGHNRLDLAKKQGVKSITARFLEAKDANEAKGKGAITNIAEGRGTAMDAARFFKGDGTDAGRITRQDLEARGVPLREKMADDGLALSALHGPLFRRVIDGSITQERGAIIGRAGLSGTQQEALVTLLDKRPKNSPINNDVLKEMTDGIKASASKASGGFDLFGDTGESTTALHKFALQASIKARLGREKKLFGLVSKTRNADQLARGDNTINAEKSGAIAKDATEALAVFDQLKGVSGPISKHLNHAAERIANGEPKKKVEDETYRAIVASIGDSYKL